MAIFFNARLRKLRESMNSAGLSNVLLTSANDIYYYTGFRVSDGDSFLRVGVGSRPVLFVSPLENEASELRTAEVRFIRKLRELELPKTIGFDEHSMTAAVYEKLKRLSRLQPAAAAIKKPRMVKDSHELGQIRKAVAVTAKALESLSLAGRKELDVAKSIDIGFMEREADNAFDTIVASGRNAAFVHHRPGAKKIGVKELVIIDLGARFRGYCADVSRTLCQRPGRKEKGLIEGISRMQSEIMDYIEPGKTMKELNSIYEKLMKKEGYRVMHGFGHGVGLNVHEMISGELEKNMVITVEPGAYVKGFGGCRIEDMLLLGKKNRLLTKKIKQPFH